MSEQDETASNSPKPKLITHTKTVVENNIAHISSVAELANLMGYSRSYFSSRVKEVLEMSPSEIIREKRFQKIKEEIRKQPFESSDAIAKRVGFTGGNKRLYKFLSDHFSTIFTKLRKKLVFGIPPSSD